MDGGRGGTRPSKSSVWPEWLWQRDCWDRQLRIGASYSEKWEYVRRNPVRADLVENPDDWPWQGEMNSLPWHDT